jgi:hypothetical protein
MSERKPDERDPIPEILKAGALYFAVVFGAGFALGTIRTLWIVPSFGARRAELMEAPIMFAITILASRWVVRRLAIRTSFPGRIAVGLIALGLLLLTEFAVALWIRGLTIVEYLAGRIPSPGQCLLCCLQLLPSCHCWEAGDWKIRFDLEKNPALRCQPWQVGQASTCPISADERAANHCDLDHCYR